MKDQLVHLEYEVELQPGEKLTLPAGLVESIGPGRWTISVTPVSEPSTHVRDHSAFLNSYGAEDEGLYDDYPTR